MDAAMVPPMVAMTLAMISQQCTDLVTYETLVNVATFIA